MRWGVVVIALAGCDKLFDIEHVAPPPIEAAIDAPPIFLDAPEPCPGAYLSINGTPTTSRYVWMPTAATWPDAEDTCEKQSVTKITHLAVFEDLSEMSAVREHFAMMFTTFTAHVGYARNLMDDPHAFFAVTGDALPLTGPPWNVNEPSAIIGEDAETTVRIEHNRDLTDEPWDFKSQYVCECDHRRVIKTFTLF